MLLQRPIPLQILSFIASPCCMSQHVLCFKFYPSCGRVFSDIALARLLRCSRSRYSQSVVFAIVFLSTPSWRLWSDVFVGLLTGSFVRDARCYFSRSKSPFFVKFGTDVQRLWKISSLTFQKSRSTFKVKTAVLKIFHLWNSVVV